MELPHVGGLLPTLPAAGHALEVAGQPVGVADQRHPLPRSRQPPSLFERQVGLAASRPATDLHAGKRVDRAEQDGLFAGERVGDVGVLGGPRHDVALRKPAPAENLGERVDGVQSQERAVLWPRRLREPVGDGRQLPQLVPVGDPIPLDLRQREVIRDRGVREDQHVGPPLELVRPPRIGTDIASERVERVSALIDGVDDVLLASAALQPLTVLHDDRPGLDLHGDDPGAGHRHEDVNLVFLLVAGDPLPHHDETVLGQLFAQLLDDHRLGVVPVDGVLRNDAWHVPGIPQVHSLRRHVLLPPGLSARPDHPPGCHLSHEHGQADEDPVLLRAGPEVHVEMVRRLMRPVPHE